MIEKTHTNVDQNGGMKEDIISHVKKLPRVKINKIAKYK